MAVKPIPDEYRSITPYLYLRDASRAIDFYKQAFGARELMRMPGPDGRSVAHAELKIGDSVVMMSDTPDRAPSSEGTSTGLLFYVEDVDRVFKKATEAGAKVTRPLENMFYGDRTGTLIDPFHHEWMIATHVEDVSEAEMAKRMKAESQKMAAGSRN